MKASFSKWNFVKAFILIFLIAICIWSFKSYRHNSAQNKSADYKIILSASVPGDLQFFWNFGEEFSEASTIWVNIPQSGTYQEIVLSLDTDVKAIRVDLPEESDMVVSLYSFSIEKSGYRDSFPWSARTEHNITLNKNKTVGVELSATGEDPYIVYWVDSVAFEALLNKSLFRDTLFFTVVMILFASLIVLFSFLIIDRFLVQLSVNGLKRNALLIIRLSLNDFKKKYSDSVLGIVWAFAQPVVTIMIYIFVFQVGFKAAPVGNFPFALWLIAGIVPWFCFAESLVSSSSCLTEYSYLVKKIVFDIDILPVVKVISCFFVHMFFIVFTAVVYTVSGHLPGLHFVQIIYYAFCLFCISSAFAYFTSSITPFFKDFGQIVNIFTQIGMWLTPIMWSPDMVGPKWQWLIKINPIFYIVKGYRDSYIGRGWVWQTNILKTLYFWVFVLAVYYFGMMMFKHLRDHYADVL